MTEKITEEKVDDDFEFRPDEKIENKAEEIILSKPKRKWLKRNLIGFAAIIGVGVVGFLGLCYLYDRHNINAFMEKEYGKYDSGSKCWIAATDKVRYDVCASQDITLNGEPHQMVAVCGELPDDSKSHAASGIVDLYVMKCSFTGITPVVKQSVESGSFGKPGTVRVLSLGKDFYGFAEEGGWTGQGYTNGYMTIYVPTGKTFHQALRFTTHADDEGVSGPAGNGEEKEASVEEQKTSPTSTSLDRSIVFVPKKGSSIYSAQITSIGTFKGEEIDAVHTLNYNSKKHEYSLPKGFRADMGF